MHSELCEWMIFNVDLSVVEGQEPTRVMQCVRWKIDKSRHGGEYMGNAESSKSGVVFYVGQVRQVQPGNDFCRADKGYSP